MSEAVHVVCAQCQTTNRVPRERLGAGAPCRMMAPAFEEAAARLAPGVRLAKLDTEAEAEIAARYAIRAIPTLIALKSGREVARRSGASDLPSLLQWIESNVKPNAG